MNLIEWYYLIIYPSHERRGHPRGEEVKTMRTATKRTPVKTGKKATKRTSSKAAR